MTVAGLALGLGSAGAAALRWWWLALVLWLLSRLADGLDGPLARRRARADAGAGGLLDITSRTCRYRQWVLRTRRWCAGLAGGALRPAAGER